MGEAESKPRPGRKLAAWLAGFVLVRFAVQEWWLIFVHDKWIAIDSVEGASRTRYLLDRAFHAAWDAVDMTLGTALVASFVLLTAGFVTRYLAQANVRAGHVDPLDLVRAWTKAHPAATRALSAAALLAGVVYVVYVNGPWEDVRPVGDLVWAGINFALLGGLGAAALYGLARAGAAALLAPTLATAKRAESASKDEITFDAVAVTGETRMAVFGMLAANVGMVVWLSTLSMHALYHDKRVYGVIAAFVAAVVGAAQLFRRGSTVAIGVDGVRVQGTSRTRFFAYRDLDAARVNGTDVELVRKDRVVVRFQLHGEDAARRDAVLSRIRGAIDRVKEGRGAVAAQLVSTATAEQLARAVGGAADYRGAALTREQLWSLVEGPEVDSGARRLAAEALARTSDDADRARLRVAAEQCAAPDVSAAIERLAEEDAIVDGPSAASVRRTA